MEETLPEARLYTGFSKCETSLQLNALVITDGIHSMLEGKITNVLKLCYCSLLDMQTKLLDMRMT